MIEIPPKCTLLILGVILSCVFIHMGLKTNRLINLPLKVVKNINTTWLLLNLLISFYVDQLINFQTAVRKKLQFFASYVETLCWWPTQRPGDETDQSPFAIWWTCWQHFPFLQSNITHHLIFFSIFGLHHLVKEISGPLAAKCSAVFISWWLTLSTLSEFWDQKLCFICKLKEKTS